MSFCDLTPFWQELAIAAVIILEKQFTIIIEKKIPSTRALFFYDIKKIAKHSGGKKQKQKVGFHPKKYLSKVTHMAQVKKVPAPKEPFIPFRRCRWFVNGVKSCMLEMARTLTWRMNWMHLFVRWSKTGRRKGIWKKMADGICFANGFKRVPMLEMLEMAPTLTPRMDAFIWLLIKNWVMAEGNSDQLFNNIYNIITLDF